MSKHQWVDPGDVHVYRACNQCGKRVLVSRDADPTAEMAVDDCPGKPLVLCRIEHSHLDQLRAIAHQLHDDTVNELSFGDVLRRMVVSAQTLMEIVRYAEALEALRGPGEPYVHACPKEEIPGAVILGLDPRECDGIYPRTRDGRCQGCGTVGEHPQRGAERV